jgi:hypothetical protein
LGQLCEVVLERALKADRQNLRRAS